MNILKEIRNNLRECKLSSFYNEDFYKVDTWKPSPITMDYNKDKDLRMLYDGIYKTNKGSIFEFQVGIISNVAGYYEFFVEDFIGNSHCRSFTKFEEALKVFIDLSNLRYPVVYKNDEHGNAVKTRIRAKPYAKISK